jgi:hypothetical protein
MTAQYCTLAAPPHPPPPPTCSIVAAACLGQSACVVRASIDVFDDPCPGISKTLYFAYW